MSRVQSSTGTSSTSSSGKQTDLRDVDINQFLTLMITELQNQDPLNPMSNADFMQQISTIRQIGSTNQLTESLQAVFLGQNLGTATSLIGKKISALSINGDKIENVEGVVERVTIAVDEKDDSQRTVQVHIGDKTIDLKNVREIVKDAATTSN